MLNSITIVGRLTANPELKGKEDNQFATFTLAINGKMDEHGVDYIEFIDCSCGQHLTKVVSGNLQKGDKIVVSGRFSNRPWTAKDGSKRVSAVIYVDDIEFVDVLKFNEPKPVEEPKPSTRRR